MVQGRQKGRGQSLKYGDGIFHVFFKVLCLEKRIPYISPAFSFNNMFLGGRLLKSAKYNCKHAFKRKKLFVDTVYIM